MKKIKLLVDDVVVGTATVDDEGDLHDVQTNKVYDHVVENDVTIEEVEQ